MYFDFDPWYWRIWHYTFLINEGNNWKPFPESWGFCTQQKCNGNQLHMGSHWLLSVQQFPHKRRESGAPYSTRGALESGMKEANTAANHPFTSSFFQSPLLPFSYLEEGGRLISWSALHFPEYKANFISSHLYKTWLISFNGRPKIF